MQKEDGGGGAYHQALLIRAHGDSTRSVKRHFYNGQKWAKVKRKVTKKNNIITE